MQHLIVRVEVWLNRLIEWEMVSARHAAHSRDEAGCVRFDVLGSAPHFTLHEVWRDVQAMEAHRRTDHYERWRSRMALIQVRPRTHEAYSGPAKLIPASLLPAIAATSKGRKIVFTNGCFDVIHPGHVHLLGEAKAQGDVLIVGVNSDGSTAALKPGRPVQPLADRIAVLSAIEAVDYVVPFDSPTPTALVAALRPAVLVKGADHRHAAVPGSEHAGRLHFVELLGGHSTTATIRRLQEAHA